MYMIILVNIIKDGGEVCFFTGVPWSNCLFAITPAVGGIGYDRKKDMEPAGTDCVGWYNYLTAYASENKIGADGKIVLSRVTNKRAPESGRIF